MSIFSRYFGKEKLNPTSALDTLDKMNETLDLLVKKENVLLKKASMEQEKAKDFSKAKNKRAAIQCLKKKKMYEHHVEQLGNYQLRIHDQMIMLEGVKATSDTVNALRDGASIMKQMNKETNIDNVDSIMDDINEQTDSMKQIQDALSVPIGAAADFDDDELEFELAELSEVEFADDLLKPPTTNRQPQIHIPEVSLSVRSDPQIVTDDAEIAAIRESMAL
ncbi:hypothetical protein ZOSMA_240G00170 [Zostera marina]|uniref:Charged multivesicular body protein 4b n=1 Tax=Zostera marina TaxID=29655 RepID=A0A0K9PH81_ZOSMR|nr:hypothetical protein ZOSMA_240G00170 [Zostera marina]